MAAGVRVGPEADRSDRKLARFSAQHPGRKGAKGARRRPRGGAWGLHGIFLSTNHLAGTQAAPPRPSPGLAPARLSRVGNGLTMDSSNTAPAALPEILETTAFLPVSSYGRFRGKEQIDVSVQQSPISFEIRVTSGYVP